MTDTETVKKLRELLSDDLFEDSRWSSWTIVERVESLIMSYKRARENLDIMKAAESDGS